MKDPTNSAALWGKIHLGEGRLFAATNVFWNHPELALLFPDFLVQAHFLMRCGFRLMSLARERALDLPDDPVAVALATYLQVHLEEELGHDRWMLDDLGTLGWSEREVLEAEPTGALVELVEAQRRSIVQVHPVSIMGYLILIEGYPPLVEQLEDIRLRTGAPTTAFRCLKAHAEDDPTHLAELNQTLDEMELGLDQKAAVAMSAFAAIEGVAAMFEELLQRHRQRSAAGSSKELLYARA
jgi:hypothetical protein